MKVSERKIVEYVVVFDSGATHHCNGMAEAKQFGSEMSGVTGYGTPTKIVERTKYVRIEEDTAYEF